MGANPDLLVELGAAYRARGESRKTARAVVEALSLDSSRGQLVALYAAADPGGCAVVEGQLNVQCPVVHEDVCRASEAGAGCGGAAAEGAV